MSWSRWPFGGGSVTGGGAGNSASNSGARRWPFGGTPTNGDDYIVERHRPNTTSPHSHGQAHEQDDILIFRYDKTNYPLHFPPHSIDDRRLTVGYAREQLAEKLNVEDIDSVRFIYKGKHLDNDNALFADFGMKSGKASEILATVRVPLQRPGNTQEDESEDGDDSGVATPLDQNDSGAAARKRRNRKKRRNKNAGAADGSPAPAASQASRTPYPVGVEHLPMPDGAHPVHKQAAAPAKTPAPAAPQGPLAKLDVLTAKLAELETLCQQFITAPPADPAKRTFEHKKLSETILQKVLLEADGVTADGGDEALAGAVRTARRALVKEAQAAISRIDDATGS